MNVGIEFNHVQLVMNWISKANKSCCQPSNFYFMSKEWLLTLWHDFSIFPLHFSSFSFFLWQYGELSLTTNPGFALYSTQPTFRKYNVVSSPTNINNPNSTTTTILRSKSPPNIYTRLPSKEYPPVSLTPTPMSPKLMTSSFVGYGSQNLSPTKHLLVTTTPFMDNGDLTTTATNLADKCILSSVRMPLLNVNYKAEINNRINNGIITNGSAISQLASTKESWKYLKKIFTTTFFCWTFVWLLFSQSSFYRCLTWRR